MSMHLMKRPRDFDVVVTENTFGDILTDEASVITGSLGMLPSGTVGGKIDLYEPAHGSAPKHANKNIANPLATILTGALLLRHSFGLDNGGRCDCQGCTQGARSRLPHARPGAHQSRRIDRARNA